MQRQMCVIATKVMPMPVPLGMLRIILFSKVNNTVVDFYTLGSSVEVNKSIRSVNPSVGTT